MGSGTKTDSSRQSGSTGPQARAPRSGEEGLALVATLLVLALMGGLMAASLWGGMAGLRTSNIDYQSARTFYAAEAAAEAALADLYVALEDGLITDVELAGITAPDLEGFDFTGFSVTKVGDQAVETITDGAFAGLYALTQAYEIITPATSPTGMYSAVELGARTLAIPMYQFGVFYEGDLEIHPGPPMNFTGRVHSNSRIYLNSNNVWFREVITTPDDVIHNYKHTSSPRDGTYIEDASSVDVQLTFDSRTEPDPEQFKARSAADFDNRLQSGAYGVKPLSLPLPEGMDAHEIVRPKEVGDTELEQETKLAWLADMYVTVDLNDIQNKKSICSDDDDDDDDDEKLPRITVERPFGGAIPDNEDKCKIFDWSWETFVDSRELRTVDVLDVDINELHGWIDNNLDEVSLIYVEFIMPTGAMDPENKTNPITWPVPDGAYPVLRIRNAAELPGPLTIGTEHPLYVWGDYNTVNKQPSAVGGDAYDVLSDAWDDSEHGLILDGAARTEASPTTINASILAGHSATPCDINVDLACISPPYGGGFENFPRFLETWTGVEYKFRGSIVSLWEAKLALGQWSCCSTYYSPPIRNWGFDLDLLDPANLPPGTPHVGSVTRTSFREAY